MYGSAPWKAFWQVRNTYKSGPPFSTLSGPMPAGGGKGFTYAPRKHARSDGKASGQPPAVKVPSVLEKAESAIRKAIVDRGARIGETPLDWEVLDPERRGVAAVDAIRAWIPTLGAKGVREEEVRLESDSSPRVTSFDWIRLVFLTVFMPPHAGGGSRKGGGPSGRRDRALQGPFIKVRYARKSLSEHGTTDAPISAACPPSLHQNNPSTAHF